MNGLARPVTLRRKKAEEDLQASREQSEQQNRLIKRAEESLRMAVDADGLGTYYNNTT